MTAPDRTKWDVTYDPPPIGTRVCDWQFAHVDFDGAPDSGDDRCGYGPTEADCWSQIQDMEDDA